MRKQNICGIGYGFKPAVIGADGSLVFSRVVPTSEQHLRFAFAGLKGEVNVHLEAGESLN